MAQRAHALVISVDIASRCYTMFHVQYMIIVSPTGMLSNLVAFSFVVRNWYSRKIAGCCVENGTEGLRIEEAGKG